MSSSFITTKRNSSIVISHSQNTRQNYAHKVTDSFIDIVLTAIGLYHPTITQQNPSICSLKGLLSAYKIASNFPDTIAGLD